jgi:hypothetical protein
MSEAIVIIALIATGFLALYQGAAQIMKRAERDHLRLVRSIERENAPVEDGSDIPSP